MFICMYSPQDKRSQLSIITVDVIQGIFACQEFQLLIDLAACLKGILETVEGEDKFINNI